MIAPFFNIPVVYCPHGWAMDRYKSGSMRHAFVSLAERALSNLSARIIAVSESERTKGLAIGIAPEKIATVPNGLRPEPPRFTPETWEDDRLKVLFVGRLDRQKGIDVLLSAVAGMQDKLSVRIIGDTVDDEKANLFENCPHVHPLGWKKLPEVSAFMAACDVLVMPSRWEGLPLVALEAMRLKKPIVAARVGGLPEIVVEGQTGYLFETEDAKALSQKLDELASAPRELLTGLGVAAEKRFHEQFTARKMCEAVTDIYCAILDA